MNNEEKKHAKRFILNAKICRIFQDSPFCWRIVQRPEGYVGDAEMMEIIYRSGFEGDTPWAKLVHKEAINIQKERIKQQIGRLDIANSRLEKLQVKAGFNGVLHRLSVALGQSLSAGQEMALIGSTKE